MDPGMRSRAPSGPQAEPRPEPAPEPEPEPAPEPAPAPERTVDEGVAPVGVYCTVTAPVAVHAVPPCGNLDEAAKSAPIAQLVGAPMLYYPMRRDAHGNVYMYHRAVDGETGALTTSLALIQVAGEPSRVLQFALTA
jgi:hypothetical protein